jgi:hypothetical protein
VVLCTFWNSLGEQPDIADRLEFGDASPGSLRAKSPIHSSSSAGGEIPAVLSSGRMTGKPEVGRIKVDCREQSGGLVNLLVERDYGERGTPQFTKS